MNSAVPLVKIFSNVTPNTFKMKRSKLIAVFAIPVSATAAE